MELANWLELRSITDCGDKNAKPQRLQTIQIYLKQPLAQTINLDMQLSVVAANSNSNQGARDPRRMS